jgi:ABC-type phosphate/phosphonate transport system substrate-binding protein
MVIADKRRCQPSANKNKNTAFATGGAMQHQIRVLFAGVLILIAVTAITQTAGAADAYVFSAPPRSTQAKEQAVYGPIARYLSQVIGKPVVYEHSDNWLNYQNRMQQGKYDIVFDGPHFIGWRMAKIKHEPLVKLPGDLKFVVFVKADSGAVQSLKDLEGRTLCGLAPPNLATLTMYDQYPNPLRQPMVVEVESFEQGYAGVAQGRCVAGVMRDKMFGKLQKARGNAARVVWASKGTANQGFSAGPRVSGDDRNKIIAAMLAPEAREVLDIFFERYSKSDKRLVPAGLQDYAGLGTYLRDVYGFTQ